MPALDGRNLFKRVLDSAGEQYFRVRSAGTVEACRKNLPP
jgi:hypothetical protein